MHACTTAWVHRPTRRHPHRRIEPAFRSTLPSPAHCPSLHTAPAAGLIYWRPTTPGQRHKISIDYDALGVYTGPPVPALSSPVTRTGGRDHTGRLAVRGRGGGDARTLRNVDYDRRDLDGIKVWARASVITARLAPVWALPSSRAGLTPGACPHIQDG
eukprot:365550-Chlamydomonas_euryale.AAC.5